MVNKKISNKVLLFFLVVAISSPFIVAAACDINAVAANTLDGLTCNLRNTLITIGNTIVVIGWIIAGLLWLTAAGKPEKLNIAKTAITACVVGTILIVLADASGTIIAVIKSAFGIK